MFAALGDGDQRLREVRGRREIASGGRSLQRRVTDFAMMFRSVGGASKGRRSTLVVGGLRNAAGYLGNFGPMAEEEEELDLWTTLSRLMRHKALCVRGNPLCIRESRKEG